MSGTNGSDSDLLKRMASEVVPAESAEHADRQRRRVVARIGVVLREESMRKQRAVWWRRVGAMALVAAVLIGVVGWSVLRKSHHRTIDSAAGTLTATVGSAIVLRNDTPLQVGKDAPRSLYAGDEIRIGSDGHALVTLSSGPVLMLSSSVGMKLGSDAPSVVELRAGQLELDVPKLAPGRSFAVRTPHVSVVVHGTRFVVDVRAAGENQPLATFVRVTEGVVSVHGPTDRVIVLQAGASWSTQDDPAAAASVSIAAPSEAASCLPSPSASDGMAKRDPEGGNGSPKPQPEAHSTLSEENRLFRGAIDATRRGRNDEALGLLDQLLSRFPRSALAPQARVERFRCLQRMGRDSAAAEEARRYLAEHPDGFARDEARGMVLKPAQSASPNRGK